jgi:GNAT superfamily N-acetyltransferase
MAGMGLQATDKNEVQFVVAGRVRTGIVARFPLEQVACFGLVLMAIFSGMHTRLAVDQRVRGHKLGASLLQDAVKRCAMVTQHTGIRALLVHALHDRAKQFYELYGFQASSVHPLTLLLRLQEG